MKYSKEEINKIIDLKGANGEQIDIFDLHGLLFVGNSKDGCYDLSFNGRYCRFSEHSIDISYEDFEDCKTDEDVVEQFYESLREAVQDRLI